jgi:ATP phosphoribosyltransferase
VSPAAEPLVLALPKGRVLRETVALFARAGVDVSGALSDDRRLVFDAPGGAPSGGPVRVLVVRGADVPAYVEGGAADAGVAGLDVLRERGAHLYEPIDLGVGKCRLVVAEPIDSPVRDDAVARLRIATKYPEWTRAHYLGRGEQVDIIRLHGAIELAPLVGLCDRIVDLVDTGETLRQNRLRVVEEIAAISSRLVVNRARLKLRAERIRPLVDALRATLEVKA